MTIYLFQHQIEVALNVPKLGRFRGHAAQCAAGMHSKRRRDHGQRTRLADGRFRGRRSSRRRRIQRLWADRQASGHWREKYTVRRKSRCGVLMERWGRFGALFGGRGLILRWTDGVGSDYGQHQPRSGLAPLAQPRREYLAARGSLCGVVSSVPLLPTLPGHRRRYLVATSAPADVKICCYIPLSSRHLPLAMLQPSEMSCGLLLYIFG